MSSTSVILNMIAQGITLLFTTLVSVSILAFNGKPVLNISKVSYMLFIIAAIAIVAAAFLIGRMKTYLPFLGETVFPSNVIVLDDLQTPESMTGRPLKVTIKVPDVPEGSMVVYWASNPASSVLETPKEAYANTKNAGATRVASGSATLRLACPSEYKVRGILGTRALKRHVHYRVQADGSSGMFGPVKTVDVIC